jgi:hypothetical protein
VLKDVILYYICLQQYSITREELYVAGGILDETKA